MKSITTYLLVLLLSFFLQHAFGQENYELEIQKLKAQKEQIAFQEKEALKLEVKDINERLDRRELSDSEADLLKAEAARKRALNIENRIAILDNKIQLLQRNSGQLLTLAENDSIDSEHISFGVDIDGKRAFSFRTRRWDRDRPIIYDRRTYSHFVMAIGLNNAIIEGQSISDSPYKVGGSRFFEIGWQWRTRVFKNTNWLRFHYGFSFQFNGLKPENNQIFVQDGNQTMLEEFEFPLDKSKLRMDNLVMPVYFEFGPSKYRETEKSIRYSIQNQFRFGIGGYGGFNLGTRQKLKYTRDGQDVKDKFKRDYNTSDIIYGVSAYAGFDDILLYVKYDLNPIFKDAAVEQRNISLGLRFDM